MFVPLTSTVRSFARRAPGVGTWYSRDNGQGEKGNGTPLPTSAITYSYGYLEHALRNVHHALLNYLVSHYIFAFSAPVVSSVFNSLPLPPILSSIQLAHLRR